MFSRRQGRFIVVTALFWLVLSPYLFWSHGSIVTSLGPDGRFSLAAPTINSPTDMTYENGTLNKKIVWSATDPSPKNYTVTRNGTVHKSGAWSGGPIEVLLNHLYSEKLTKTLPAAFSFVCTVFNNQNESGSDQVIVTVVPDTTSPIITAPGNFSYEQGSFGHNVTWTIIEANPRSYNITRLSNETSSNHTVIRAGSWDGRNITVSVNGLNATHWYLYTLFVNDTLGHNATSSVNVTVYTDVTPPTVNYPDDLSYEFGSKGHKITWQVYDSNPKNYTITVRTLYNNTKYGNVSAFHYPANITQSLWVFTDPKGQNVSVSVDSIYLGNYTYTILLFDKYGHSNSDSLNLTIYPDIRAPVVIALTNLTYEEGYTGHRLNWSADESNPRLYNLTRDGTVLMNGTWRGQNFSVNVDRLSVGLYVFNMTLTDFFNQSTITLTSVNVTPDAHIPTIKQVVVIQSFSTASSDNLTVQAYVWDLNNISSIKIEWGIDKSSTANKTMESQGGGFYSSALGVYPVGSVVWYRLIAVDNSSVKNVHITEWTAVTVISMIGERTPGYIWGGVLALGLLSTFIIVMLYFRTRSR